jgi:hypothetical protein
MSLCLRGDGASAADTLSVTTAIVSGAAVQIDYSGTFLQKKIADTNPTSLEGKPVNGRIASATTAQVSPSIASTNEVYLKDLVLSNSHASAATSVELVHAINNGTARRYLGTWTLLAGESIRVNGDGTVFALDANGGVKSSVAAAMTRVVLSSGAAATYTTPAGCRALDVEVIGGGAAGGGASSVASSGGGGGGGGSGGYGRKLFSPPSPTYTYTVGAGGSPGAAGANAGGNGSASSFGSVTANGGTGGAGCTSAAASRAVGGAGATAGSGGDVNEPGEPGATGLNVTAALVASGAGGNSKVGGGAASVSAQGAGTAAVANSGAGGSGGASVSAGAAVAGGAGGSGIIIVTEIY